MEEQLDEMLRELRLTRIAVESVVEAIAETRYKPDIDEGILVTLYAAALTGLLAKDSTGMSDADSIAKIAGCAYAHAEAGMKMLAIPIPPA